MKPILAVNTPFGTFERRTYKRYTIVSVWLMPDTGDYADAWHLSKENVEKHEFSGKFQLCGLYFVQLKSEIGSKPSAPVPYIL